MGLSGALSAHIGRQPAVLDDPAGLLDGSVKPANAIAKALPDRLASSLTMHVVALTRALSQALSHEVVA